ncbi:MAG: hypothetical protein ACRDYB_13515 [Acidimicrobiales bacterium]
MAVFLSVLLGAGPAGASSSALTGKSASQILAISLAAARSQGSVHITQTGRFGGPSKSTMLDQSLTKGRELDTGGAGKGEILVIGGVAYVKGTTSYLTNMGFSQLDAAKGAGKWISFRKGQPGYGGVADDETLDQTLVDAVPDQPLTTPLATTLHGQPVFEITGIANRGASGQVTFYVSANAPYLPVEVVDNLAIPSGPPINFTMRLSKWHEAVSVSAPSGSTPVTSLVG